MTTTVKIDYASQLHEMGLKATTLRLALLEFLLSAQLPVDAQACMEYLERKKVDFDQTNVYRNLDNFVEAGKIKKINLLDGKYYYEKMDDCSHVICQKCGLVIHSHLAAPVQLVSEVEKETGFKINQHAIDFFGLCNECQN